jgi:hypothetical protein
MPFLPILDKDGNYRDDAGAAMIAVMLAPEDPDFREEFLSRVRMRGVENGLKIRFSTRTLTAAFRFAERRDQRQQVKTRANDGRSVGYQLLYRLILANARAPNASLADARRILVRGGAPVGEKAMQSAWQRLESVSHLWAVAVAWEREFGSIAGPPEYQDDIGIFLGHTEWVREQSLNLLPELKLNVASWVPPQEWVAPGWDEPFVLAHASAEVLSWRNEIPVPRRRGRKRLIQN